jgi:hypothetical protein
MQWPKNGHGFEIRQILYDSNLRGDIENSLHLSCGRDSRIPHWSNHFGSVEPGPLSGIAVQFQSHLEHPFAGLEFRFNPTRPHEKKNSTFMAF